MESWNVIRDDEGDYILLNIDKTPIRLSKRANVDLPLLMAKMEEANVPVAYTAELQDIYFTILTGPNAGDYDHDGKIRVSCSSAAGWAIERTFIHEIAHHVDDNEDVSSRPEIMAEKKTKAKHLDSYAKKNSSEYVAIGFEIYYFGDKVERTRMRKKCKRLYWAIRTLHKKYSAK